MIKGRSGVMKHVSRLHHSNPKVIMLKFKIHYENPRVVKLEVGLHHGCPTSDHKNLKIVKLVMGFLYGLYSKIGFLI